MSSSPGAGTILWMAARGGRADAARIALTAVGAAVATVAVLAAAAVVYIGPDDGPYSSELLMQPGLHQGVVIALVLLCVPVLAFVGQCSRIGAPDRDRRLAAFRLSGAAPRDVARVVGAETGLAAGLGSLLGLGGYLVGRVLLDEPVTGAYTRRVEVSPGSISFERTTGEVRSLPTDVLPPWWLLAVVVIIIPVGAAAFSQLALRRVTVSPFGVVRRQQTRPLRTVPAVLFVAGTAGMALFSVVVKAAGPSDASTKLLAVGFVMLFLVASVGLILGIATIAAWVGHFAAARTGRPALLIAARRLAASPFRASRVNAVLLLVVLIGGATQGVRAAFLTMVRLVDPEDTFFLETLNLVNLVLAVGVALAAAGVLVTAAEAVVTSRSNLAALTAAGTPRSVLRRSLLLESLLPLAPTTVLAAACGVLAARGVFGTTTTDYRQVGRREFVRVVEIPVPWLELGALVAGTLVVTALMAAATFPFMRRSTDPRELRVTA
jgi:hypothetical protein